MMVAKQYAHHRWYFDGSSSVWKCTKFDVVLASKEVSKKVYFYRAQNQGYSAL